MIASPLCRIAALALAWSSRATPGVELRSKSAVGEAGAGQATVLTSDRDRFGFANSAAADVTLRAIDSCHSSSR